MQTYQEDFLASANKCAKFIFNDSHQRELYESHIRLGKNPRDHIYFDASLVLGKDDEFDTDIQEYEETEHQWSSNK
jgi:hypothetical protein